ncbi:MAG TPA: helicase-related protein [Alphaproteobacteria bacterium]
MSTVRDTARLPGAGGDKGGARIIAVLGPTNTGKTHLALERMLGHRSGMIGFPLRLLARENYDRIVRLKGRDSVALVTGEERIVPPNPRWFVCTVEAMPLDREVAFLAIDEIQMCADRERGHVFTDRLLHARGYAETMFLGAETAKRLIRALVPHVEFVARPRFSTLTWTGPKKITRLPRRSAAVAFSAAEVYGMAELVRRQRGGAAVVFGALSPRTRNAQVAMYQAGEVDYLVATDAIGMGLNMDIDHVAFAQRVKFDGRGMRRLSPAELGQIAGRAGRHMNNGTFGTTTGVDGRDVGPLEAETIAAIEEHRFPSLNAFQWRNTDLEFSSPRALLASLDAPPPMPALLRTRGADDHLTLAALAADDEIVSLAAGREGVRLLWDACQIPDFRKALGDAHVHLVGRIFRHLRQDGRLPTDWVAGQVARLDAVEGDIDTLVERLARIRTWTYVSHRPRWLDDAAHWQDRAREVEDRLSDALHERLLQRFVDRRAAVLARARRKGDEYLAAVTTRGEVLIEGERAGRLEGFNFVADADARDGGGRDLLAAANKALRRDVGDRVRRFAAAADAEFALDGRGVLRWHDQPVGKMIAGDDVLRPRVETLPADLLEPQHRDAVRRRMQDWLDAYLAKGLAPLYALRESPLSGAARGLAYALCAGLGCVPRRAVAAQVEALAKSDRPLLASLGVHIGTLAVFMPALKGRASTELRAMLWACGHGEDWPRAIAAVPKTRAIRRAEAGLPASFYAACLFLPAGPIFARADRLEGLDGRLRGLAKRGPFAATPDLAASVGAEAPELAGVLAALGYRAMPGMVFVPRAASRPSRAGGRPGRAPAAADSPFASLGRLMSVRRDRT